MPEKCYKIFNPLKFGVENVEKSLKVNIFALICNSIATETEIEFWLNLKLNLCL